MAKNIFSKIKPLYLGLLVLLLLTQVAAAPLAKPANSPLSPAIVSKQANLNDGGVDLKNWWLHNFTIIFSPYSCHAGVAGCLANPDYHVTSWLLSQSSVKIEKSWSNPALTFWTKHYSRSYVTFCYVEVQVDGKANWDRLKAFTGTKDWYKVSVDLKNYSGESIKVKFYCEPNRGFGYSDRLSNYFNKQILYIQDVKIVPDSTVQ
jgi:hypothetical protein